MGRAAAPFTGRFRRCWASSIRQRASDSTGGPIRKSCGCLAAAAGKDNGPRVVDDVLYTYVRLLDEELSRPGQRTTVCPGVLALLAALEDRRDCVVGSSRATSWTAPG